MRALCQDQEFIELFQSVGAHETAQRLGMEVRAVYGRRSRIEQRTGVNILSPDAKRGTRVEQRYHHRIELEVENGVVLVGSDAHYWPGIVSTAHRAFVRACRDLNPVAVIMNGDVFDGAGISRHPPIGWEQRPSVIQEIEACTERLEEIRRASEKADHIWTLGNHDARFETRLATVAPEYARVHGVHLKDHFPEWEPAWSCWINDDTVIKHRYKGGIHATHNNTIWSGKTTVTGHLHSLKVTPLTDYNGTRWGVDTGTLAQVGGPQFVHYLEDNPVNWRAGFPVLTYERGRLLWPELVHVIDEEAGEVEFRGKVYRV